MRRLGKVFLIIKSKKGKILNQNITKNPILAKRKTSAMKEIEENHFKN